MHKFIYKYRIYSNSLVNFSPLRGGGGGGVYSRGGGATKSSKYGNIVYEPFGLGRFATDYSQTFVNINLTSG